MLKVICPGCNGAKSGFTISCGDHGCQAGTSACDFCKGEGQVSSEVAERWRNGNSMRKARIKRGLTVMQEAAILGVDPILPNDIEHGRRSAEELKNCSQRSTARADPGQRRSIMIDRDLIKKLRQLGPEQVVDGLELCPSCDGLSPGIAMDGETVMHCRLCHDQNAVTVADADRWRDEMRKRYGRTGSRSGELD